MCTVHARPGTRTWPGRQRSGRPRPCSRRSQWRESLTRGREYAQHRRPRPCGPRPRDASRSRKRRRKDRHMRNLRPTGPFAEGRRGIEMCAKRGRWLNRLRPIGVAGADVALSRGDGRHRRDAHGSSRCRKRPMRDSAISASSVRHRLACLWSERISSSQAPAPSAG